jgi:tetratricopeptide (TPR) repeat protein
LFRWKPAVPPALDAIASLPQMVAEAHASPILRAFGAPAPKHAEDHKKADLVALHLATTFHKLAVVLDVLRFYGERSRCQTSELALFGLIDDILEGRNPRATAAALYRQALVLHPRLAEAHYALARLLRADVDRQQTLDGFAAVLLLVPHPEAPSHAFLLANAHWERAIIFEALGSTVEALSEYRAALTKLDNFGVHHVQVARFFRRLGLVEEAAEHFRRCMTYSHRYFAEFVLPPLEPAQPSAVPSIEVVHTNRRGEKVVFWQGAYFAVPRERWPAGPKEFENAAIGMPEEPAKGLLGLLRRVVDRSPPAIRRATSVAALEDLP